MINDPVEDAASHEPASRRRRIRFSLLELMLVTGIVAAWLPAIFAIREIPTLQNSVDQMNALTTNVSIVDEQKLCLRSLPSVWHNIYGWKYYLPDDAEMELRLATEGINSLGDPAEFDSYAVPNGTHTIHMMYSQNVDREYVTQVFLDNEAVITKTHPPDWIDTSGSSSSGTGNATTEALATDKPVILRRMRYRENKPTPRSSSFSLPHEYDAKGNLLWLTPKGHRSKPASHFTSPGDHLIFPAWGHREGMRLVESSSPELNGLLGIQPSRRVVMEDQWNQWGRLLNAVSARPVLTDSDDPQRPEGSSADDDEASGIRMTITDSLQSPDTTNGKRSSQRVRGLISDDGKTMRVFVHYSSFPSGARLVVELIFDADHPDRIGFRPHQSDGSIPIQACQFMTRFDSRCQWRRVTLLKHPADETPNADRSAGAQATDLPQLYPDEMVTSDWQLVPSDRLPRLHDFPDESAPSVIELTTDVSDFSKLTYPPNLADMWRYQGMPVRQKWILPRIEIGESDAPKSSQAIIAELRSGSVYPDTNATIPGGAVIQAVRLTVPMPAENPIWMEVTSQ